jgi:peptidoglycan/LPS O-acetylase OafA/YrhL
MFGIYRYALASLVVLAHLWPGWLWAGFYAVFSFYLLSGYLMTLVLNETYAFSTRGIARYFANRALRIYPTYFACAVLALGIYALIPVAVKTLILHYTVWGAPGEVLKNVVLFGLTVHTRPSWIPPAWTLGVELSFYVLMGLVLARHWTIGALWLLVSLGRLAYLLWTPGLPFEHTLPLAAAALPFSIGSVLYHVRRRLPGFAAWRTGAGALLYAGNVLLAGQLWADVWVHGFHASLALSTLVTASLLVADPAGAPPALRRIDRVLGDVSYPLYLCHWHVGAFVWWLLPAWRTPYALFFVTSLAVATAVAWGLHWLVEAPLAARRSRLRGDGARREGQGGREAA